MASDTQALRAVLDEYLTFLQHHRGLREATLYFHRRWGRQFLAHLATHLPDGDIGRLTITSSSARWSAASAEAHNPS